MSLSDLFIILKEKFPDTVLEFHEEETGSYVAFAPHEGLISLLQFIRDDDRFLFDHMSFITAVDTGTEFEIIYSLYSYYQKTPLDLRAELSRENPSLPSCGSLWRTAEWHERELYDMFGITFNGHPGISRIFLPGDWRGHPLRKDYEFPETYGDVRISFPGGHHEQI